MISPGTVLTVGHSTHSLPRFIELLTQHGVTAVADVRSTPASRFSPQFNRASLTDALQGAGIGYAFLGLELGARSNDPGCYVNGKVRYERLAATAAFAEGIQRLNTGRRAHRIAVMCAEADPLHCHRTLLVARHLVDRGVPVQHILGDFHLEEHQASMTRLRTMYGLAQQDLLHTDEDLLALALSRQEDRIAYVDRRLQGVLGDAS